MEKEWHQGIDRAMLGIGGLNHPITQSNTETPFLSRVHELHHFQELVKVDAHEGETLAIDLSDANKPGE